MRYKYKNKNYESTWATIWLRVLRFPYSQVYQPHFYQVKKLVIFGQYLGVCNFSQQFNLKKISIQGSIERCVIFYPRFYLIEKSIKSIKQNTEEGLIFHALFYLTKKNKKNQFTNLQGPQFRYDRSSFFAPTDFTAQLGTDRE